MHNLISSFGSMTVPSRSSPDVPSATGASASDRGHLCFIQDGEKRKEPSNLLQTRRVSTQVTIIKVRSYVFRQQGCKVIAFGMRNSFVLHICGSPRPGQKNPIRVEVSKPATLNHNDHQFHPLPPMQ